MAPEHAPHHLLSERILLRELLPDQAGQVVAGTKPDGQEWADGYPLEGTIVAARNLVRAAEAGTHQSGFGMYQIIDRKVGCVVGDIGFHCAPDVDGVVEVGYGIVPSRRGEGLVSESLRALADWALSQPGVSRVVAGTEPDHLPSQRVLINSGFDLVGTEGDERRYELTASARQPG